MRLYIKYCAIQMKSQMQYKASFFFLCIGQFLITFNVFLGVAFLMDRFQSVGGFRYEEILLCFGIMLTSFTLAECFLRGFDTFDRLISNGQFDRILVRPQSTVLQVMGSRIEFSRAGRMLQAVVMLACGITGSSVDWTVMKKLTVVLMLIGGVAVISGLYICCAALSFFTLEGLEIMNILTYGAKEYGKYPIGIYGKKLLFFTTFFIPYALFQYYPLLYLLGRGPWWYGMLPLCAAIFLIPCCLFWQIGVRHYKSTGS